jgi:hypothetical protein
VREQSKTARGVGASARRPAAGAEEARGAGARRPAAGAELREAAGGRSCVSRRLEQSCVRRLDKVGLVGVDG